jgi:hypothetical protein
VGILWSNRAGDVRTDLIRLLSGCGGVCELIPEMGGLGRPAEAFQNVHQRSHRSPSVSGERRRQVFAQPVVDLDRFSDCGQSIG